MEALNGLCLFVYLQRFPGNQNWIKPARVERVRRHEPSMRPPASTETAAQQCAETWPQDSSPLHAAQPAFKSSDISEIQ